MAPTLPWVVLHWSPAAAPLTLHLLPDADRIRYHLHAGLATAAADDGGGAGRMLALATVPGDTRWTMETGPGRGLVLRADGGSGPGSLLIAYGSPDAIRTAFRAASHLRAHETRAVGGGGGHDTLTLTTGAHELDDAVAWMTSRLRHGVLRAEGSPTEGGQAEGGRGAGADGRSAAARAWLWAGLGSVAIGDEDGALRSIRALTRAGAHVPAALLAGRLALTTGRTGPAEEHVELLLSGPGDARDKALRMLARRTVADALRYAAPDDTLARLREGTTAPEGAAAPPRPSTSGLRLPTLGSTTPLRGVGAWLAAMLDPVVSRSASTVTNAALSGADDVAPEGDTGSGLEVVVGALRAWNELARDPTDGWASWRSLVQEGMDGPRGGAIWDDAPAPPAVTGALLAAMAHGWLGIFPDAPVGRLVLAPRIPANLRTFRAQGIPVGDARVTMRYDRRDSIHHFIFEIERGRVPPYLVFETVVPHTVGRVLIDGTPVDPDIERVGAGTRVRLQTPLDAPRVVEIEPA